MRNIDDLRDCLIKNYSTHGPEFVAAATGYSLGYVRTAACILGLAAPWHGGGGKTKAPRWNVKELMVLKQEYGRTSVAHLSARLGRTPQAIHRKASAIGLGCRRGMRWDNESDEVLKKEYSICGAAAVAQKIGCTISAVRKRAAALGIRRSGQPSKWFQE